MATLSKEDALAEERTKNIALKLERSFIVLTNKLIQRINYKQPFNAETAQILNDYYVTLQNTPYEEVFDDFLELYGQRADEIQAKLRSIARKEVIYTGADLETMDAMINTDFERVSITLEQVGTTVRQEVIRGVMLGAEAQIDTDTLSGRLKSNVETEIRTGEMAFNRTVSNTKAVDLGFTQFEYVGPLDGVTRDFCEDLVGKVLSLGEIKALDNDQGLNVFQFGGGYNCRHVWVPVRDGN